MFTDMNVSQDLNEKFSEYCKDINIQLGIDFTILILQVNIETINNIIQKLCFYCIGGCMAHFSNQFINLFVATRVGKECRRCK